MKIAFRDARLGAQHVPDPAGEVVHDKSAVTADAARAANVRAARRLLEGRLSYP